MVGVCIASTVHSVQTFSIEEWFAHDDWGYDCLARNLAAAIRRDPHCRRSV
jgi:hypothetical protein